MCGSNAPYLRSRAPDTAPRRNPGVLHNPGACGRAVRLYRPLSFLLAWRTAQALARTSCSTTKRSGERGRVQSPPDGPLRGAPIKYKYGANLSGPCFLLFHINADPGGLGGHSAMPKPLSLYDGEQVSWFPQAPPCLRPFTGWQICWSQIFALPRRA